MMEESETSSAAVKHRAVTPVVTGISPKEGVPGTQITIRGENLGLGLSDIVGLSICKTDCLLSCRWESAHKLLARVGKPRGTRAGLGDIVLTTRSGGKGNSTVQFRLYTVSVGIYQESAVWVDETRSFAGREPLAASSARPDSAGAVDDPLGISDESESGSGAAGDFAELFPDGSADMRMKNFVPQFYLLKNHRKTALSELKSGLAYMQRQAKSTKEGPADLIKSNLTSFISCVDSLAALRCSLDEAKSIVDRPPTAVLKSKVDHCIKEGETLFSDVLDRKERADATRNALSLLTRFKFVFFLPHNIDVNLKKGEYSAVLNDYARAKSLFSESDIPLFREAMVEVEKQMFMFRQRLKEKLLEMPGTLTEQKEIIRFLLLLEADTDPGWDCLCAHFQWVEASIWDEQQQAATAAAIRFGLSADATAAEADSDLDNQSFEERHLCLRLPVSSSLDSRFAFVDDVLALLRKRLPPFWKFAQAYLSGSLSGKCCLYREDEVEGMLSSLTRLVSWQVVHALLTDSVPSSVMDQYNQRFTAWPALRNHGDQERMMTAVRQLRLTLAHLYKAELNDQQLNPLRELSVTLRLDCVSRIVNSVVDKVKDIQLRKKWKLQTIEEPGFAKTLLPDLFETHVTESLPLLQQILWTRGTFDRELELFSKEKFRQILLESLEAMLVSFKGTLETLCRLSERADGFFVSGGVKENRLLMAMANCDYVLRYSLRSLCHKLGAVGVAHSDWLLERCRQSYANLRTTLFKCYSSAKCLPFQQLISSVHYGAVSDILGVSNNIKDLVLCVVSVRAETFLLAPHFSQQILSLVVHVCAEQLLAAFPEGQAATLSSIGATQALLDLLAFESALGPFLTAEMKESFEKIRAQLVVGADEKAAKQYLEAYLKKTRLTLLSLQAPPEV